MLIATTSTRFQATAKETTKEAARPKAFGHAASFVDFFVVALNSVDIITITTIDGLRAITPGCIVGQVNYRRMGGQVDHVLLGVMLPYPQCHGREASGSRGFAPGCGV